MDALISPPPPEGWRPAQRRAHHPGPITRPGGSDPMTLRFRRAAAVLLSACAMTTLAGGWRLLAQETGRAQADTKARKTAKRSMDPTRRVPNYFGQLGLSDAQKDSI